WYLAQPGQTHRSAPTICEKIYLTLYSSALSSCFCSDDNTGRPIQFCDCQLVSRFQLGDQFLDSRWMIIGPVRLWQHVVNYIQSAALEQTQGLIKIEIFSGP